MRKQNIIHFRPKLWEQLQNTLKLWLDLYNIDFRKAYYILCSKYYESKANIEGDGKLMELSKFF